MRLLKVFLILTIFSQVFIHKVLADENFDISANVTYEVINDNSTKVTKEISILNKKEFVFSPDYTISFGFTDIKNIQVYDRNGSIPFDYNHENNLVTLKINFPNPPKGINTVNSFTIDFVTNEIVDKKGEVFEIDIPGVSNPESFTEYNTAIKVPQNYPKLSILKPNLKDKKETLEFSLDDTKGAGIVLIFGEKQFYELNLNYNISNPNVFPIVTEVAFPPNTNYQKVLINSLSELPQDVEIDDDGNWIAKYPLSPRERKTVEAKILVEKRFAPDKTVITEEQIKEYTESEEKWEASHPKIRELALRLKTPQAIYEYVVENLIYDFSKVASSDKRLGAVGALENPESAVCLEYSDLLVALFRSAKIPARSVEGYAYTRNDRLRPASLSGDILHAWVEYYDLEKETWVMVDPTWGSTTRGIDYFSNLDLDHIAFVVKGVHSDYPVPAGGYKFDENTKDIEVSFLNSSKYQSTKRIGVQTQFPKFSFAGIPLSGFVTVTNIGNEFIKNQKIVLTNTSTKEKKEYEVKNLPPFGSERFHVSFETNFLSNSKHRITVEADERLSEAETMVSFIPDLNLILLGGGIFAATGLVSFITVKTGRVYLQRRKK